MPVPLVIAATAALGWVVYSKERGRKFRRGLFPSVPEAWWQGATRDPSFSIAELALRTLGDHQRYRSLLQRYAADHALVGVAHYHLARYLHSQYEPVAALEAALRHLELEPDHPVAHHMVATCHLQLGNHRAAREHFRRFIELEPTSTLVGQVRSSLEIIENALKRRPAAKSRRTGKRAPRL